MANGWTNANNFKPWTQYELTPGAEDIIIPKGSYLSQDIVVHGDPNYASCNIKQGVSVGDIAYGSANTPIDNSGSGMFYPKDKRTPYIILENLILPSSSSETNQTINNFNNHMGAITSANIMRLYPNNNFIKYISKSEPLVEDIDNWLKSYVPLSKLDRVYSGFSNYNPGATYTMFNNIEKSSVVGYYTIDEINFTECNMENPSSWYNYQTCFLMPINNLLNSDYSFLGLIRNGSSYTIITSKDAQTWSSFSNFTLTQDFVGVTRSKYNTYILFKGGATYQISDNRETAQLITTVSNFNMIDICSNGDNIEEVNHAMFAIGKNTIYTSDMVKSGTGWKEISDISKFLENEMGIQRDSDINYTEWMTYIEENDAFIIGSSQTPYILYFSKYTTNNYEIKHYKDLSCLGYYNTPYYPCHCFLKNGDYCIMMYYNFTYVVKNNNDVNYVVYPNSTVVFRVRG